MPRRNEQSANSDAPPPNEPDDLEGDDGDGADDDGDDGDGDGDPEDHVAVVTRVVPPSVPPPTSRPPPIRPQRGPRGPRNFTNEQRANSRALAQARANTEAAYAQVDELLAGLNFATRAYEVRVTRLEPDVDENGTPCSGILHTYHQKVTVDAIQNRFGGGVYELKIYGPHPQTGKKGIIREEVLTFAGLPKPMPKNGDLEDARRSNGGGDFTEAIRAITETSAQSNAQLLKLLDRPQPNVAKEVAETLQPILSKVFEKSEEMRRIELEEKRAQREAEAERRREEMEARKEERERQRDEERRREDERRREEDRRRDEEAKKREEERERREEEREARREEERKREDERRKDEERRREEERTRREEERQRREDEREARKAEREEEQRRHERDMQLAQERMKQDADRQRENFQLMQTFMNTQVEMIQNRAESGGVAGIVDQLRLLNELRGDLRGDNDEPSGIQKFNEGLQDIVQTAAPLVSQVAGAFRKQQPQQQGQQGQVVSVQAQALPTKPIAVDLGPRRPAIPQQQAQPQAQPQAQSQPQAPQPQQTQATGPTAPTDETLDGLPNDLTAIVLPGAEDDMNAQGTLLVKNVDFAIKSDLTPEQIVEQILDPFEDRAPMLMSMVRGMAPEQVSEFLSDNVPASWAIVSPRGEEIVTQAFEMWAEDVDD